jgi:hypothetical protein
MVALAEARSVGVIVVAGIVLLGLAVRLYGIDRYSLWIDEVTSLQAAQRGVSAIFTERFGVLGNQTVWYHLLLWLSALPVDPSTNAFFVRLPEALAGALVPLVIYGLGRELFGRSQGILAALLVALSLPLIDRSQDARQYSMVIFLTVCMAYCLVRAGRTGKPLWWWLFALAASANVLVSYTSLLLVLPPFAPYLLYLLWRAWRAGNQGGWKRALAILAPLALLGVVCATLLLDIMRVPRSSIDLSQLSPGLFYAVIVSCFEGFTQFGIDSRLQGVLQLLLVVAALIGAYAGLRKGGLAREGVWLCGLVLVVPMFVLAALSTVSLVFLRYVLFGLPFYLLLVAHGMVTLWEQAFGLRSRVAAPVAQVVALGFLGVVIAAFLFGAYVFNTPGGHLELSLRPDFRDAAAYLSEAAHSQDTIIVADQPMHGLKVMSYYWKDLPPANVFDVADPRLYAHDLSGDVYWVFWLESIPSSAVNAPDAPWRLLSSDSQGWANAMSFGDVVVLKDSHPSSALDAIDFMARKFDTVVPGTDLDLTARGSIRQARGDMQKAVDAYRVAVPSSVTISDEDLRSAEGFASIGMPDEAWYWGVLAKFDQPANPQAHRWLAQSLAAQGYTAQSQAELQIAQALEH